MWIVRELYKGDGGVTGLGFSGVYLDRYAALSHAIFRRRALNRYWVVEVCEINISSAHLVEK